MKEYSIALIYNIFLAAKRSKEKYPEIAVQWKEFLPAEVLKKNSVTISQILQMHNYLEKEVKMPFLPFNLINSLKQI